MTNVTPVRPSRDVCLWRRPAPSWDDGIAKEGSDYDNRQQSFRTRLDNQPALAVHVSQLVKRYGDMVALDYFDLDVNQGEIFGLLGPNGSGKTTAINCILALLTYDSGTIRVFGQPMTPTSYALKRRIGIVPQNVAVFNELTVTENIDYFCSLYVPKKTDRAPLVEESIEFVGLQDFRKFRPGKLSGGLLRRLNIACGIAHKPNLIFLDEPTVAVDPQSRNSILEASSGSTRPAPR